MVVVMVFVQFFVRHLVHGRGRWLLLLLLVSRTIIVSNVPIGLVIENVTEQLGLTLVNHVDRHFVLCQQGVGVLGNLCIQLSVFLVVFAPSTFAFLGGANELGWMTG